MSYFGPSLIYKRCYKLSIIYVHVCFLPRISKRLNVWEVNTLLQPKNNKTWNHCPHVCEHSTPIYNHLFYKVHVSGCVSKACKVQVGRSVIDLKEQAEKRGNPASSSLVLPNIHSPCLLASWNGGGGNSFQPFSRSYWKNRASKVQITGRDEILWGPNATLCVQGLSPSEHEWWPKQG